VAGSRDLISLACIAPPYKSYPRIPPMILHRRLQRLYLAGRNTLERMSCCGHYYTTSFNSIPSRLLISRPVKSPARIASRSSAESCYQCIARKVVIYAFTRSFTSSRCIVVAVSLSLVLLFEPGVTLAPGHLIFDFEDPILAGFVTVYIAAIAITPGIFGLSFAQCFDAGGPIPCGVEGVGYRGSDLSTTDDVPAAGAPGERLQCFALQAFASAS
jgi:hypothetical protein